MAIFAVAEINKYFIGATAISILKVIIVGITTAISAKVSSIAPNPTTIPPRQPTMVNTTHMIPKRLNSAFANNLSKTDIFFTLTPITLFFIKVGHGEAHLK